MYLKSQFPIFAHHPDLVYLDNAATVQKPQYVLDEVYHFLSHDYANIHRGMYALSLAAEDQRDRARECVALSLGAKSDEVIFTSNATHASNTLAWSFYISGLISQGDILIFGVSEHHATITPWQDVAARTGAQIVYIPQDKNTAVYDWSILETIDMQRVKVIGCSLVSNVIGCKNDLSYVKKLSKKYQFFFVIDIAQAVPHFAIDVQELEADFVYFTGHKVGGLTGIGVLWGKREHLTRLQPLYSGGGAIDIVGSVSHTYQPAPDKFEPGTPNVVGAVSLRAAFEWIASLGGSSAHLFRDRLVAGYEVLNSYEKDLIKVCDQKFGLLQAEGLLQIVGGEKNDQRIGLFSWTSQYSTVHDIGRQLAMHNVCIRTGMHCTHPLHHSWDIDASARMSLWAYNDYTDIQIFFDLLEKTIRMSLPKKSMV